MDEGEGRKKFLEQVRKGCRIAKKPASWESALTASSGSIRPAARASGRATSDGVRTALQDRGDVQRGGEDREGFRERLAPRARPAGPGCTRSARWSISLERVGARRRSGSRPTWRTLSCIRWERTRPRTDSFLKAMTGRTAPFSTRRSRSSLPPSAPGRSTSTSPRTTAPCSAPVRTTTRPPLPGDRPERQARHPAARGVLAPRRKRSAHQEVPAHLLGRLHVPQRRHDEAPDLERHPRQDDRRSRCPRLERVSRFRPFAPNSDLRTPR